MIEIIFGMLGGLALFVFGLKSMSDGLQKLAGKKAHKVMGALTSVPIVGVLVGGLVTIITQSSTLVTVMVVGFVNTSMLNLKQAIAVIMGANIGTTLTAQLIAFRITDMWVFLAAIGFPAYFFFKRKIVKNLGFVAFSLGMLLLGMALMSQAMVPLRTNPAFQGMILTFADNRVLAMMVGALFTAVIQSSTAATSVIVAMTMQDLIPFEAALPLILGTNIGTTITAVFASIGGTRAARRAAMAHVLFNAFGTVIFLVFLNQYAALILLISPAYVPRQVANAHTLFSVINTIMFLPFINQFAALLTKIIPGEDEENKRGHIYLDKHLITGNLNVAMAAAQKELVRMAEFAKENVALAMDALLKGDQKKLIAMREQEELVDDLEKEITRYLAEISRSGLTRSLSALHTKLLHAANDVERISDHADNLADLAEVVMEDGVIFSDEAIGGIEKMYAMVTEIYDYAITSLKNDDKSLAPTIAKLEAKIDKMYKTQRESHIKRLKDGQCNVDASAIFIDIITNFERIGDHSNNLSHVALRKL